jgi:type VI secretion system protein ImpA
LLSLHKTSCGPPNCSIRFSDANPSGSNLRYSQIYADIREARREEDATAQGEWTHAIKTANYSIVVKLATDALARQSKDLQIAVWLVDAATRCNGFEALVEGLDFVRTLLEEYWETIYPQLEDGDPELRAAPLAWLATYLSEAVVHVAAQLPF